MVVWQSFSARLLVSGRRWSCDNHSRSMLLKISDWSWTLSWPIVVARSMLIACLAVEMNGWMCSFAKPLWPCIKVKVIDTSMSIYICHAYVYRYANFECHSFRDITNICQVWDTVVTLVKVTVVGLAKIIKILMGLSSQQTWWALLEQFLK